MGERRAKTVQKRVRSLVAISSQTRLGNPRRARRFVEMFFLEIYCKEYKVKWNYHWLLIYNEILN